MPYSNIQGATPDSLVSIAVYLANPTHAHHEDYELTPVQVLGAASVQEFISFARESFKANRQKMKAGRPPENAANWFIVRTPEDTHLEPQEMAAYEQAAREVAGMGAPVVGITATPTPARPTSISYQLPLQPTASSCVTARVIQSKLSAGVWIR